MSAAGPTPSALKEEQHRATLRIEHVAAFRDDEGVIPEVLELPGFAKAEVKAAKIEKEQKK